MTPVAEADRDIITRARARAAASSDDEERFLLYYLAGRVEELAGAGEAVKDSSKEEHGDA